MKKVFINTVLASLICFNFACKEKPEIEEPEEPTELKVPGVVWVAQTEFTEKVINPPGQWYNPKLKILDDVLYVCHNKGIFSKKLNEEGSKWELYAFAGLPVIDFVKKGNKVLAVSHATTLQQDKTLLLSNAGEDTYEDLTSPLFFGPEYEMSSLWRIVQHPQNPDIVLVYAHVGVFISENFGTSWRELKNTVHRISQYMDIAFHPLDPTTIFYAGETINDLGFIEKSSNSGNTWSYYQTPDINCVHSIAFHPTNPNILVYSGEAAFGKSDDKGNTWKWINLRSVSVAPEEDMYFLKVLFDENNPEILYANGYHAIAHREADVICLYRSTDMGDSWHLAFEEKMPNKGDGVVYDMVKYKNKIFFYSYGCGIVELELEF